MGHRELTSNQILIFEERGKPEYPEKTFWSRVKNQQLNPHRTLSQGIELGGHCWEATATIMIASPTN